MPRVTRAAQADNDIADLLVYLSRQSPAAAARFRAALGSVSRSLARSSRLGRPRPDIGPTLRSHPFLNTYIIYYRIIPNGIEIARVFHGARDVDTSMFDD